MIQYIFNYLIHYSYLDKNASALYMTGLFPQYPSCAVSKILTFIGDYRNCRAQSCGFTVANTYKKFLLLLSQIIPLDIVSI